MVVVSTGVNAPVLVKASTGSAVAAPVLGRQAAFTHITVADGLSDQRVQALAQDRAGFMWFGTNNGLNRYDGYSVVAYRNDPSDPHSISGNLIEDIYLDRNGTLWIGTRSGLNAFDRRTERFTRYRHDPANPRSVSSNVVMAIHEDRSGALWLGTTAGLNRFDRSTGTFTAYRHDPANPRSLSEDTVRAIAEDGSGTLWIGTMGGLNRLDSATGTFTIYRHDPADPRSLSHDIVWDVLADRAGALWVGTDGGGVNRFDPATASFIHYRHDDGDPHSLGHDRIDCLFEDISGALWIGTFGGGVSVLDATRQIFETYRRDSTLATSLSHDYVAEIMADRSGLIWIGTHGNGVDVHDPRPQAFTIYQHDPRIPETLASNNVSAVSEDRDGVLWIGTQDRGLDRFDPRSGEVAHYPSDPTNPRRLGHGWVSALQHDPKNGALWIGTYGGGVYRLDPVTGRFTPYRHDAADPRSLSHDAVADLHMDHSGLLWIGTRGGGLNRFDPAAGTFSVYRHDPTNPRSLSNDWASAIAEAPDGTLWIGTLGSGLNRLDPATGMISHYQHDSQDPTSLGDDNIWTLHVDRSGVLWIGTVGGGLDRFDPHRTIFTHYRERDGLASDRIVSILEDGQPGDRTAGDLWISTGRGLSKLDRDRKTFHVYGTSQGLPLTEFNRGGYTTARGELLMTSIHGLIAFNPNAVPEDRAAAPVVFTNFLLANKPVPVGERSPLHQTIDQTDSIALTYADRVISLEFAALNYRAARQTRYRYKLEGFDDDWIEIDSTKRLVTYTNLAPSRYVFRVASANADGVWNPAGRAIALIITPPWWTTWWFRGLAFALVAGCAAGAFAWRVSSLERRRRALEAEIAERKQREDVLRASNRQIQDLAGRLITAQEAERTRIARDLHDDSCQEVAGIAVDISNLVHRRDIRDVAVRQALSSVHSRVAGVAESLRLLSHDLHPSVLQHIGLVAALEAHCVEVERHYDVQVKFSAEGDIEPAVPTVALSLFRIAQEALRNAARHGRARHAAVTLARRDDSLTLSVVDDGVGFDVAGARQNGGLGLVSIEERARIVKGQVTIRSQFQQGTRVDVRVPVSGALDAHRLSTECGSGASAGR